jgi:hypothetical protein
MGRECGTDDIAALLSDHGSNLAIKVEFYTSAKYALNCDTTLDPCAVKAGSLDFKQGAEPHQVWPYNVLVLRVSGPLDSESTPGIGREARKWPRNNNIFTQAGMRRIPAITPKHAFPMTRTLSHDSPRPSVP